MNLELESPIREPRKPPPNLCNLKEGNLMLLKHPNPRLMMILLFKEFRAPAKAAGSATPSEPPQRSFRSHDEACALIKLRGSRRVAVPTHLPCPSHRPHIGFTKSWRHDWIKCSSLGWAMVTDPASSNFFRILSPNTTVPHQHIFYILKNEDGKMSQDQGPVTGNMNSFNTTGSQNHNINSLNNNNQCFNTNTNITVTDDRAEILTWLSPLEPRLRHSDLESRRVRNVGDWLLQTEEFRKWKARDGQGGSQNATIFCSGNPGVGKTYIR